MNTPTKQRTAFDAMQASNAQALTIVQQQNLPATRPITAVKCEVERDEPQIFAKLRTLAKAAGPHWYYRYPVKNNKTGQVEYIEGPTIKCAMTVARLWGNSSLDVLVEDVGDGWMFYARLRDFQTGFEHTRSLHQRKSQDTGMKDADRQRDIVFQIGQSKAIRNVVCQVLSPFTDFGFDEAKNSFVEAVGKDANTYRSRILDRLKDMNIDVRRVEVATGRPAKEWLATDMAKIIAELQAINDNMASVDDTYPMVVNEKDASPPSKDQPETVVVSETVTKVTGEPAPPIEEADERVAEWVHKRIADLRDCDTLEQVEALHDQVWNQLTRDSEAPLLAAFLQKEIAAQSRIKKGG